MTGMISAGEPLVPRIQATLSKKSGHLAFRLGLAGVIVHFLISGNLLWWIGIDYQTPGGNPLMKLHPATYLILAGAVAAASRGGLRDCLQALLTEASALLIFLILTTECMIYLVVSEGLSGSAVYIESFLSAGLLALTLETGTNGERRILGYVVISLCLLNALIAVGECLSRTEIIPSVVIQNMAAAAAESGGANAVAAFNEAMKEDFRPAGLYPHPLTGALVTFMAIFLLIGMKLQPLKAACLFGILAVGLIAFSGRAATFVTMGLLIAAALFVLIRGLLRRKLSDRLIAGFFAGIFVLLPLLIILGMETSIGGRLMDHLYYDDSAEVRVVGWKVLKYLSARDLLFGTPASQLTVAETQIGITGVGAGLENCWLIFFLNLGAIPFATLLVGFLMFCRHLLRHAPPTGWLLLMGTVLIVSTSNSLATKAPDLIYLTACMLAVTAFAREPATELASSIHRPAGRGQERKGGLGIRPTYRPGRGLSPRPSTTASQLFS